MLSLKEVNNATKHKLPTVTVRASLNEVLRSSVYRQCAELKGISEPIELYSLYPQILAGRVFGERKAKMPIDSLEEGF